MNEYEEKHGVPSGKLNQNNNEYIFSSMTLYS